mmetsp:Transcript_167/g.563  ORF Transcript_167/g.563 Transcript_167/m.563 type:complete len:214 (+) Transcript_167:57-698(+)
MHRQIRIYVSPSPLSHIDRDEPLFSHPPPERGRYARVGQLDVGLHPARLRRVEGHGDDLGEEEAELHAHRRGGDAKLAAERGELLAPRKGVGPALAGDLDVVEVVAADQEAGVEDRRIDDVDALLAELAQQPARNLAVHEGGDRAREHCPVELHVVRDEPDHADVLCADADGLNLAGRLQLRECAVGAEHVRPPRLEVRLVGRRAQVLVGVVH